MDLAGIVDPTGVADGANAILQAKNGDYFSAGISVIGLALPGVGDLAKAPKIVKNLDIIDEAIEATTKVVKETSKESMERGVKNEAITRTKEGVTKNTKTFTVIDPKTGNPINVKPDGLDSKTVTEIKDTKSVSNTKQIRGERQLAKEQNKKFEIITGKNTKVSKNIPKNEIKRVDYLGPNKTK